MGQTRYFDSYGELKSAVEALASSRIVLPYSDVGRAVFGYRVLDPDSGYEQAGLALPGLPEPVVAEIRARTEAALSRSELLLWRRFGSDLSTEFVDTSSLSEINSVARTPGVLAWSVPGGHKVAIDYSSAHQGRSRVVRISPEDYNLSPVEDKVAAKRLYLGRPWPVLLGLEHLEEFPAPAPPST